MLNLRYLCACMTCVNKAHSFFFAVVCCKRKKNFFQLIILLDICQILTIFSVVDTMEKQFYVQTEGIFRSTLYMHIIVYLIFTRFSYYM